MSAASLASGKTGKTTDVPAIPTDLALPAEYKAKRCRFCRQWSYSLCPWDTRGTVLKMWFPVLPWNRGTKNKPSGDGCKVCMIVSWFQKVKWIKDTIIFVFWVYWILCGSLFVWCHCWFQVQSYDVFFVWSHCRFQVQFSDVLSKKKHFQGLCPRRIWSWVLHPWPVHESNRSQSNIASQVSGLNYYWSLITYYYIL